MIFKQMIWSQYISVKIISVLSVKCKHVLFGSVQLWVCAVLTIAGVVYLPIIVNYCCCNGIRHHGKHLYFYFFLMIAGVGLNVLPMPISGHINFLL